MGDMEVVRDAALACHWFRWPTDQASIRHDPKVWVTDGHARIVGFLTPRKTKRGASRFGPFFLIEPCRGKGIMRQAVTNLLRDVTHAYAWIEDGNHDSERFHLAIDFCQGGRIGYGHRWTRVDAPQSRAIIGICP